MKTYHRLAAMCGLASALAAHAGPTYKGGSINNETWDSSGSPYLITNNLQIYGLTIRSGVEVLFLGGYSASVYGVLNAEGIACAPIRFARGGDRGWAGLHFYQSVTNSYLNYCIVEGSTNTGVTVIQASPWLNNCIIANNTNSGNKLAAGGVYVIGDCPVLSGCVISNNAAAYYGGIRAMTLSDPVVRTYLTLRNTVIAKNHVLLTNSSPAVGGMEWTTEGSAWARCYMTNCVFRDNDGDGIRALSSTLRLYCVNCCIYNNSGYGLNHGGSHAEVVNSIVYSNRLEIAEGATVTYSDVQIHPGGYLYPGQGNISSVPRLCSAILSLYADSPCIDAGDPAAVYYDACVTNLDCYPSGRTSARNDMGAYGGPGACDWPLPCSGLVITGPQNQQTCLGGSALFSVQVLGPQPYTYQWHRPGGPISGETGPTLTLTVVEASHAGPYWVVVSNFFGSVASSVAQLTVSDACVDIEMYAGLNIRGQGGSRYVIRYTTDLTNTNVASWTPLATNILGNSNWFYIDMDSPFSTKRFYNVRLEP